MEKMTIQDHRDKLKEAENLMEVFSHKLNDYAHEVSQPNPDPNRLEELSAVIDKIFNMYLDE